MNYFTYRGCDKLPGGSFKISIKICMIRAPTLQDLMLEKLFYIISDYAALILIYLNQHFTTYQSNFEFLFKCNHKTIIVVIGLEQV